MTSLITSNPPLNLKTNMDESDEKLEGGKIFENESKFYQDAKDYWSGIEPTINGMLGGFGCISGIDIRGSELFLKKLFNLKQSPGHKRALDCGAGIGRITKNLLIQHFDKVDLVEQNPAFVEAGKKFLICENKVGDFYTSGLQDFAPKTNYYDVIWCQWVLGHLTDSHLVDFLIRCKEGLRKQGILVIKENVTSGELIVDENDSSVTRSTENFMDAFKKAGFSVIMQCKQANFPKQLLCVKIFALRPTSGETGLESNKKADS